jgi:Small subunit of serine palmitoyltransferase-like
MEHVFASYDHKANKMIKKPQFIRLEPSKRLLNPDQSFSALQLKQESQAQHTSFDSGTAWYVQSPPNKHPLRLWFERRYYQYEVTWGLYVLNPIEKIFINSLVLIIFSSIAYGTSKVAILQHAVGILAHYLGILA